MYAWIYEDTRYLFRLYLLFLLAIGEGDPQELYLGSPFAQAIKQVQIVDNEIKIFESDAPEVTGILQKDL